MWIVYLEIVLAIGLFAFIYWAARPQKPLDEADEPKRSMQDPRD